MTALFAAADVVSHLADYQFMGPYFTAHHALLLFAAVLMIIIFRVIAPALQMQPNKSGFTSLIEVGLVFVRDEIVYSWLGEKKGRPLLFFFWTLFFFLLISNLIGLIPPPINVWGRAATGNIVVTGSLAFGVAFMMIQWQGMKTHGYGGYWKHLVPGGVPGWLWPLVWVIELVGLLTKPFALMVRLFANMTAGHAILAVLFTFMIGVQEYGNLAIGGAATVASIAFVLFIMLFETLVALIQAYIFTVLTAIFISMAVAEEH